jgi:hypothetical protein
LRKVLTGASRPEPEVDQQQLIGPPYDRLPIPLHEATTAVGRYRYRAIFTVTDGTCQLISGDLAALLDVELTTDHAVTMASASYAAALGESYRVTPVTDADRLDYALAIVRLVDPGASGSKRAELRLLEGPSDLKRIGKARDRACGYKPRQQSREYRLVREEFSPPQIADVQRGSIVSFHTWSSELGEVARHDVYMSDDGKVTVKRVPVGRHLGDHDCSGEPPG